MVAYWDYNQCDTNIKSLCSLYTALERVPSRRMDYWLHRCKTPWVLHTMCAIRECRRRTARRMRIGRLQLNGVRFAHLALYAAKLPQATIREFDGRGHLCCSRVLRAQARWHFDAMLCRELAAVDHQAIGRRGRLRHPLFTEAVSHRDEGLLMIQIGGMRSRRTSEPNSPLKRNCLQLTPGPFSGYLRAPRHSCRHKV